MQRTVLGILKKNTHVFAWAVILGFGIWGAGSIAIQQQAPGDAAGYVFGEKISATEFNRASRSVQLLTAVGNDPNITPQKLQDETWEYLTLMHAAKKRGVAVPDEEVTKQIKSFFARDNGFDKDRYEIWIRNVFGEKPRMFEEQMRSFISVQKLLDEYRPKLEPADDDVWNWFKSFIPKPLSDEATLSTEQTETDENKEKKEQDEAKRKGEFEKNKDQWKKTYIASKESEALGKAIEDIKKQANLKNLLPPPPTPEPPPQSAETTTVTAIEKAANIMAETNVKNAQTATASSDAEKTSKQASSPGIETTASDQKTSEAPTTPV